jgi:hypothetical protein
MFYTIENPHGSHDEHGQPGGLFVTGTLTYAIVVIVANLEIIYATCTHTIFSFIIGFGSIGSFFVLFYLENKMSFIN